MLIAQEKRKPILPNIFCICGRLKISYEPNQFNIDLIEQNLIFTVFAAGKNKK